MSRSYQEQRDAESAARRARRLAERAEQRAQRHEAQARRAEARAERLAERARRIDEVFEDTRDDDLFDDSFSEARPRRRRPRYRSYYRRGLSFKQRLTSGRKLYRDKAHGKIAGVCAGLADYLQVEIWQVRVAAVLGMFFLASITLPLYVLLYFVMDEKPFYRKVADRFADSSGPRAPGREAAEQERRSAAEQTRRDERMSRAATARETTGRHRAGRSNGQALQLAKSKFAAIEERVRRIESHVTSARFELDREFNKISGDSA